MLQISICTGFEARGWPEALSFCLPFSKTRHKRHPVKFLMQQLWLQLELRAWPISPLGMNQQQLHCSQRNYSGVNQGSGICSLATPALPTFARSLLLAAQLPIPRTNISPEQPCSVLPSRHRGEEEKISPTPLTPKCKQPCYGAFVKSWRLQSWWVRFSKGKAFKLVAAPWRGSSVTASKQEQIMSFILPTFTTREEITGLKGWSLNHKQY